MNTINVSKKEYEELIKTKFRYEYLKQVIKDDVFLPPLIKNTEEIIKAFKKTKKYNQKFLSGLENGLKRSSYFQ